MDVSKNRDAPRPTDDRLIADGRADASVGRGLDG